MAVMHWIAVILSIAGTILVSFKLPVAGCSVWFVANALWLVWTVTRRDWPTTVVFSVYEVMAVVGVVNWMSE